MKTHNDGSMSNSLLSFDETKLFYRMFPSRNEKAIVVLVHGFGEHQGRYDHVINELKKIDVTVYALDLRGHGRSSGVRGRILRFKDYLGDAHHMIQHIKKQSPHQPLFVIGHSMGGLVSLLTIISYSYEVSGLILSAPLFKIKVKLPWYQRLLGRLVAFVFPHHMAKAKITGVHLSHDERMAKAYDDDPLVLRSATMRWFFETEKNAKKALNKTFPYPLLLQVAGQDVVVDKDVAKRWFLTKADAQKDQTMVEYHKLFHEIYNEKERDKPISDMVNWIKERLPRC